MPPDAVGATDRQPDSGDSRGTGGARAQADDQAAAFLELLGARLGSDANRMAQLVGGPGSGSGEAAFGARTQADARAESLSPQEWNAGSKSLAAGMQSGAKGGRSGESLGARMAAGQREAAGEASRAQGAQRSAGGEQQSVQSDRSAGSAREFSLDRAGTGARAAATGEQSGGAPKDAQASQAQSQAGQHVAAGARAQAVARAAASGRSGSTGGVRAIQASSATSGGAQSGASSGAGTGASQVTAGPASASRGQQTGSRSPQTRPEAGSSSRSPMKAEGDGLKAQVVRGLAQAMKQKDGSVTLRLKPEHLGTLRVDVSVRAEQVTATLRPQSDQARELLNSNVAQLRSALESRGLSVERIEITGPPEHTASESGREGGGSGQRHPSNGSPEAPTDGARTRAGVRDDADGDDDQEGRDRSDEGGSAGGAEPRAASAEHDAGFSSEEEWDALRSLGVLRLDTLA